MLLILELFIFVMSNMSDTDSQSFNTLPRELQWRILFEALSPTGNPIEAKALLSLASTCKLFRERLYIQSLWGTHGLRIRVKKADEISFARFCASFLTRAAPQRIIWDDVPTDTAEIYAHALSALGDRPGTSFDIVLRTAAAGGPRTRRALAVSSSTSGTRVSLTPCSPWCTACGVSRRCISDSETAP
jgi:hypothetical protein